MLGGKWKMLVSWHKLLQLKITTLFWGKWFNQMCKGINLWPPLKRSDWVFPFTHFITKITSHKTVLLFSVATTCDRRVASFAYKCPIDSIQVYWTTLPFCCMLSLLYLCWWKYCWDYQNDFSLLLFSWHHHDR